MFHSNLMHIAIKQFFSDKMNTNAEGASKEKTEWKELILLAEEQIKPTKMNNPKRTVTSWLILGLTKLQFFYKTGCVFLSLVTFSVQVPITVYLVPQILSSSNFPMQVVLVIFYMNKVALYSLCPLANYLLGSSVKDFMDIKELPYPQYWYLLLTATIAKISVHVISIYGYGNGYQPLYHIPDMLNIFMILLLALVIGSMTSTLTRQCKKIKFYQEDELVENGKKLLSDFQSLKEGCQMGMFISIVFQTTILVLQV